MYELFGKNYKRATLVKLLTFIEILKTCQVWNRLNKLQKLTIRANLYRHTKGLALGVKTPQQSPKCHEKSEKVTKQVT